MVNGSPNSPQNSSESPLKNILVVAGVIIAIIFAGAVAYKTLSTPKVEIVGTMDVGGKPGSGGSTPLSQDPSIPKSGKGSSTQTEAPPLPSGVQ